MIVARYIHITMELWGGIFCLIAALSSYIMREKGNQAGHKMIQLLLAVAVLLFADAGAWLYRGADDMLGYYLVRITNFVTFEMQYVISMIFTAYITDYLEESGAIDRRWVMAAYLVGHFGMILVLISQFTNLLYYFDADNFYHRTSMFWINLVVGAVELFFYGLILWKYRSRLGRKERLLFCSYIGLPALALPIQYMYYGISLVNIALVIAAFFMFINYMTERSFHLAEQERKMGEMQIQLVISQIQPHFIYNTLNSIYYLCETDPKRAQMATNWFAELLRNNMDSMRRNVPVDFSSELHALENYLQLEKMRFEDELEVKFEIGTTNFMLPPMTLQPIVENAVKHGLGPKPEGGTVTIRTEEKDTCYEIVITDDGVGYEPEKNAGDGRTHTGIENVRKRLWAMCRGTLEIDGKKGKGTIVVIHIPKEKKKNGHSSGR